MIVPATVNFLKSKWRLFISAHPLAKGVIAYSIVWPTSSFMQQTLEGRQLKDYDWMRILRFGLFGGLYVAPTLYGWLRVASTMWPQTNLRVGALKAIVEQISYAPFASTSFYFGMSLLEGKGFDAAVAEVKDKFPKTVKVCIKYLICAILYDQFSGVFDVHKTMRSGENPLGMYDGACTKMLQIPALA
ncbi:PREDICTED: mpv17-like protein [Rhagoletis zephyria]|uniref:mpv17-like protein n=1 Tax=Rhagoletis zephyria TaxID=28612 RepID=UPI0008115B99|nr:PREDICTED: mpv17-like protein [Rhagoletis zephyria]